MPLVCIGSQLNPVETVWSVVKRELAKHFARIPEDIKRNKEFTEKFQGHIQQVLDQVSSKYPASFFLRATRSDMEELLE